MSDRDPLAGACRAGPVVLLWRWHPLAKAAALVDREDPRRYELGPRICCFGCCLDALGVVLLPRALVEELLAAREALLLRRAEEGLP